MRLGRGADTVVELDPTIGHGQRGVRPCVVVNDPDVIGDPHFPLVCVASVTGLRARDSLSDARARPERPREAALRADRPSAIGRQAAGPLRRRLIFLPYLQDRSSTTILHANLP